MVLSIRFHVEIMAVSPRDLVLFVQFLESYGLFRQTQHVAFLLGVFNSPASRENGSQLRRVDASTILKPILVQACLVRKPPLANDIAQSDTP